MADYAGDVSVKECWDALEKDARARLVDVRTGAEWAFVGVSDLSSLGKQVDLNSWVLFPDMSPNADFMPAMATLSLEKDTPIYFLCRTGARSKAAAMAMTAQGYTHCYNIACGFEGDKDESNHRGHVNGWKAEDLPWEQQ